MPGKEEIRNLLGKLENNITARLPFIKRLGEMRLYKQRGACPGVSYEFLLASYHAETRILGTESETRRRGCLSLLFERKGSCSQCVSLGDAFLFEGFTEVLSEAELNLLKQLPDDTLIGPAYDERGLRVRAEFAVWERVPEKEKSERKLVLRSN